MSVCNYAFLAAPVVALPPMSASLNRSPSLFLIVSACASLNSISVAFLPCCTAATLVVPLPAKGSIVEEPGGDPARMHFAANSTGKVEVCSPLSALGRMVHTSRPGRCRPSADLSRSALASK